MSPFKSELLRLLDERGFIHQGTNLEGLDALAARERLTGYIGFDATAPSLHAGSLVQIMLLRHLQRTGHKPIVLIGGGTTRIGDPSGKDQQRKLLTDAQIEANKRGIQQAFARFLEFGDGPAAAVMVDNDEWLSTLGYVEFLRDYGVHFTINRMLTFDSVKLRLERESPMSFLEFNYMLMQAYDFHELYKRFGCRLQMGGSDQWGNIVNGVELCRRVDQAEVFGLTSPLLKTASGGKMGKTESGAVWLDPALLSPYEYWQYWRNTADADMGLFLRMFTELPLDEIARLEALRDSDINEAKKILADEATRLLHGEAAARDAGETARRTFEEGATGADLPTVYFARSELAAGLPAPRAFVEAGLCASNAEAKRHIKAGAAKVNDVAVTDPGRLLTLEDLSEGGIKLAIGKKKFALLKAKDS